VTGQVHGILYLDPEGKAVSPLYTWQDRRGRLPVPKDLCGSDAADWVGWIEKKTGCIVPAGYGLLTHLINRWQGKVPGSATGLCTILDYVTMELTGRQTPLMDATNAHSWGFFDLEQLVFQEDVLKSLGIDTGFLPPIVPNGTSAGRHSCGAEVYTALGDNQAGFAGTVENPAESVLINIGTSGQISVYVPGGELEGADISAGWIGGVEIRPYPGGGHLLSGASLAGGSAFRLLEALFREICETFGKGDPGQLFDAMTALADSPEDFPYPLAVETCFYGTRENQHAAGSISGITKDNLNSRALIQGFLNGIADELYRFYTALPQRLRREKTGIIGVGNGLRKNPPLRKTVSRSFGLPVFMTDYTEEAAIGAARLAGQALAAGKK